MGNKKQLIFLALCIMVSSVQAGEKEELLKLRNTTTNLINELVKQGVLSEKVAAEMIKKAEADAEAQASQQAAKDTATDNAAEPGEVRVAYVPQFVKDEIRQQVRNELREEVVGDVMQKAKTEKWGVPEALPDWINRFKLSGDMRLRSQNDFMASDNAGGFYVNFPAINAAGGFSKTAIQDRLLNTTHDRHRFRERVRLAIDAKITDNFQAGLRLATGNQPDPVSTNQTLGNTGAQYDFNLDRAFLKYDAVNDEGFKWLTIAGGRIANPWYVGGGEFTGGSELVWDTDLSFEGLAITARHSLGSASGNPAKHDKSREIYATVGGFPLQETQLSAHDKWLFGGQVGLDWGFNNQDSFRLAAAYYDYRNISAVPNRLDAVDTTCAANFPRNNFSVPQFMQFGNTLAPICRDSTDPKVAGLFGLASDFNIVNVNMNYDLALFAPYHIIVGADYAKNVGFDKQAVNKLNPANNLSQVVLDKNGNPVGPAPQVSDQTNAWQVRIDVGWPKVDRYGEWSVFGLYKYIEQDAVLDAFSDSDFHLGGSNAKGWVIGGNYGLMKNVWFTGRWLSTDVINGPKYAIDTLQLDLNAKF